MKRRILFPILFLLSISTYAQETNLKPIGSWTEHLPFQSGRSIDIHNGLVYCGTSTGLFTFNVGDNSISRYSTVNRLNEISIRELKYAPQSSTLIIVYDNMNIDLLKGNQTINIPSIKDASIANKSINQIFLKEPYAYLSTGFGIVKMNIEK